MDEYSKIIENGGYKILNSKAVLRIYNNALKLLDPITTNDIGKPLNAFLDSFGKLIVLFEQKIIDDSVYLIIEKRYKEKLFSHLEKYLKLSKSKVEVLNNSVVHVINREIYGINIKKNIGYYALLENLDMLNGMNEISDEVYNILRIENNIPVQGIDFNNEMFLEVNLPEAVSFTKGCYPGQEIITRVNSRSKPVKKLVRVLFDKIPDKITVNNEEVGKITSYCFSPKYNKFLTFAMILKYDQKLDNAEIIDK